MRDTEIIRKALTDPTADTVEKALEALARIEQVVDSTQNVLGPKCAVLLGIDGALP